MAGLGFFIGDKIMELTVVERLQAVTTLFQTEADREALLMQRSIREKIELTKDEEKELEFVINKDEKGNPISFSWEKEKEKPFDPRFSAKELVYLNERAEALNKEKKLTELNLDLSIKLEEAVK